MYKNIYITFDLEHFAWEIIINLDWITLCNIHYIILYYIEMISYILN